MLSAHGIKKTTRTVLIAEQNGFRKRKIWGSHGSEYEDGCLIGYCDDHPDNGGTKHLWNVDKLLPDYTAQQTRRESSSEKVDHVLCLHSEPVKWKENTAQPSYIMYPLYSM
jgi:hypothetical protein